MTVADVREAVRELTSPRQAPPAVEYIPPRFPDPKACSPGNGNWREQLEHVYAHLIEHAQIDPDFRIALGEPKLGRVGFQLKWFIIHVLCDYRKFMQSNVHQKSDALIPKRDEDRAFRFKLSYSERNKILAIMKPKVT